MKYSTTEEGSQNKDQQKQRDIFSPTKYTINPLYTNQQEDYIDSNNYQQELNFKKSQTSKEQEEHNPKGTQFIFYDHEDDDDLENNSTINIQQQKNGNFIFSYNHTEESDEEIHQQSQDKKLQKQQANQKQNQKQIIQQEKSAQNPMMQNKINMNFIHPTYIPQVSETISLNLQRQKNLVSSNYYHIRQSQNNKQLITIKQNSFELIFSSCHNNFEENNLFYLGKAKFSFYRNYINLFDKKALSIQGGSKKELLEEMRLSIDTKQSDSMSEIKPREFTVYLLKRDYSYYKDLKGTSYEKEVSLKDLYQIQQNKNKILKLANRKSTWSSKQKCYFLNMNNKAKLASVKNFILEDPQNSGKNILLLGKCSENHFNIQVNYPLSLLQAVAIVMSSFITKSW